VELSLNESRVIGVLMEKEITTPDQYPLSLNSLTNACNQKSNRDPVLSLSESEVQETIDVLTAANLISEVLFGSRVTKYKHRFCNTEFSKLHLNRQEFAIVCVMLLRGSQTPGELRTRTQRLASFNGVDQVEDVLERLASREDGTYVVKLAREPGKRDSRYAHLFSGDVDAVLSALPVGPNSQVSIQVSAPVGVGGEQRISALEEEVSQLRNELDELKAQWRELVD